MYVFHRQGLKTAEYSNLIFQNKLKKNEDPTDVIK